MDKRNNFNTSMNTDNLSYVQLGKIINETFEECIKEVSSLKNNNLDIEAYFRAVDNAVHLMALINNYLDKINYEMKENNDRIEAILEEYDGLVDEYDGLVDEYAELVKEINARKNPRCSSKKTAS